NRLRMESLARLHDCRWEVRMVRRIREMLSLQAKSVAQFVDMSLLSGDGSIQEVTGIELDTRFGRKNFQHSTARGFMHPGGQYQAVFIVPVDHEIVIVTASNDQLFIAFVDAGTNRGCLGEIHRRSPHGSKFAGRDEGLVHGRESVSIEGDFVSKNIAATFPGQVEITVLGNIEWR